jgi:hypothetical protein
MRRVVDVENFSGQRVDNWYKILKRKLAIRWETSGAQAIPWDERKDYHAQIV